MKATAELKMLPVSVLKPAAYNPRKKLKPGDKEYEKIKNSITEFGFADPLVVNADMTIIGGHQRLTVAMELGYTEVPCECSGAGTKSLPVAARAVSLRLEAEGKAPVVFRPKADDHLGV